MPPKKSSPAAAIASKALPDLVAVDALLSWLHQYQGAVVYALLQCKEEWAPGAVKRALEYNGSPSTAKNIASAPRPHPPETMLHVDFPVLHCVPRDPFKERSKDQVTQVCRVDALLAARGVAIRFEETVWKSYYNHRFHWHVIIDPKLPLIQETFRRARAVRETEGNARVLVVTNGGPGTKQTMLVDAGIDVISVPDPSAEEFSYSTGTDAADEWAKFLKQAYPSGFGRDRANKYYPADARATLDW